PANPLNLYAAIGTTPGSAKNGVYVTSNGGATWKLAGNFPAGTANGRIALGISTSNQPATIYAAITNPTTGAVASIQKSIDGGVTWAVPYTTAPANYLGNFGYYDTYLAVSPTNPSILIAAGSFASTAANGNPLNSVIVSTNGGSTFTDITSDSLGNGPHI